MIIAYVLMVIELLAIFFMNAALVYVMYSLYEYKVYGIKIIKKDMRWYEMILLVTLTVVVLLIATALICIHTYEYIKRKIIISKGVKIMDNEEEKNKQQTNENVNEQNNLDKQKSDEHVNEQKNSSEQKSDEQKLNDSNDSAIENVISDALKSIGRGKDDEEKENNNSSNEIDIDDIVSRVIDRINADNEKKHESESRTQTEMIAAAIMGAAKPRKQDPWKVAQENLEKVLGHK